MRKNKLFTELQKKREWLTAIIEELHTQIEKSEFFLHNKALLNIKDSELASFINKLKVIGIDGFVPKSNKYQPTFFNISIITAIYQHLSPSNSTEKENSLTDIESELDEPSEETSSRPKRRK